MRYKSKTKLIILTSIIFIAFIVVLILFFKTDIFRTKRSAFFRYFEYIPSSLDILKTQDFKSYQNLKTSSPYIRKGTATIQSSSNIADSSILDKIKLNLIEKNDEKNEKNNTEIIINNSNSEFAKVEFAKEKNIMGIYSSLISNGYISIRNQNLKNLATSIGINEKYMPNQITNINIDKVFETSTIEKKHILEIVNLIKDSSPDTAYSKENGKKIKIDDNFYSTTAYTLSLDEKSNNNMQINLLEKISQDSIIMNFLASKAKLLNLNEEYTNINSLNDEIKKEIKNLKENDAKAQAIYITIYEYRQKNIKTEIKSGENSISIEHIKDDKNESTKIKINNISLQIKKNEDKYYVKLEDTSGDTKSIDITYNQTGSIENNDIKNKAIIQMSNGIKNIVYEYNDTVSFSSDIGTLHGLENRQTVILNDYEKNDVTSFINLLKNKINNVYIGKGASIGINLDPIFY